MNTKQQLPTPSSGQQPPTPAPSATPTSTAAPTTPAPTAAAVKNGLKIRGTLVVVDAEAHDYEFRAQRSTGQSTQQVVKAAGLSKLYRTTGEREPKLVAHLSVPADTPDAPALLARRLEHLTAGLSPKARPRLKGRVLMQTESTRVVHNLKDGQVEAVIRLPLTKGGDLQSELIKQMQQISQCFAINQTSLVPPRS